jgi:Domain of unknown function (DUF4157)
VGKRVKESTSSESSVADAAKRSRASDRPDGATVSRALATPGALSPADVLSLQRAFGNRTVVALLRPVLQPKLTVGATDDPLEDEADRVAAALMRVVGAPEETTSEPVDHRAPADRLVRRSAEIGAAGGTLSAGTEGTIKRAQSGGRPLDDGVRRKMDAGFGADFESVRIHTDEAADELSRSIGARAFTAGQHIFFGRSQYEPHSSAGQRLIAHELTHTLQQGAASVPNKASTVRRKFQNLSQPNLEPALGTRAGLINKALDGYNSTPEWTHLDGDLLKAQVKEDIASLPEIENTIKLSMGLDDPSEPRFNGVKSISTEIGQHKDMARSKLAEVNRAEEAAKPLKDRYHNGLSDANLEEYKKLVGDATDTADVPDEAVTKIIPLYESSMFTKNDLATWNSENTRRTRQKQDLGGNTGWVTQLLHPKRANTEVQTALQLIGETKKADELSVETMIRIVNALHAGLPGSKEAKEVADYFRKQVDDRSAKEPTAAVEKKTEQEKERAKKLRASGLQSLGPGTSWKELSGKIAAWRKEVKKRAEDETFRTAFEAKRMTVRAIAKDSDQQGGTFKAQVLSGESKTTTGQADMTLERNRASILKRTEPKTWAGEAQDIAVKQKTGLYELSASLLDPDPKRGIFSQLKFYKEPEAVVFMPASTPEDNQIFAAISELVDADQPTLRDISSEMTRITLAQSTDMGTKYVDKSVGNVGTDIRYGESGTLIRYPGGTGKPARAHELEARRTTALEYTKILGDPKKLVNEVVVEYRKHASGRFPLFTHIDHKDKRFYILDPKKNFERTGQYIDDQGKVFPPEKV